jgi:Right handed beta helix region
MSTDQDSAMGAAPGRTLLRSALLAAVAAIVLAAAPATASPALPKELWAVKPASFDRATLKSLRTKGVNAVVATRLGKAQRARVRAAKLIVVSPRSRRGLRVVTLRGPGGVLLVKQRSRTRVLALVNLTIDFDAAAWGTAVARAADISWLDLAVVPRGSSRRAALRAYLTVMNRVRRQDRLAPTVPAGLSLSDRTQLSIRLSWRPSRDNRGVARYGLYRNGARIGSTTQRSALFAGLSCGRAYRLAVDAADRTGNHSAKAQVSAVTASCAGGDSPPPPPGAPPAPPPPPGLGNALPPALLESTGQAFYVATTGSDGAAGTIGAPWRTIQKALNTLAAGQRAFVRAGTYAENLDMSRAGSPLAPITVEAYPGEQPVLTAAGSHPLEVSSSGAYFRFRGFRIQNAPGTSGGNVDIYGHHVELSRNEITNSRDQGVYTDEGSHHAQILGNWVHHNGEGVMHQSHGIYLQGDDHLVANNVIHDHPEGFGIQVYDAGDRAIVTGNTITGAGHSGIVVGGSGGVSAVKVHNNVLAFNSDWGVSHDSSCPSSSVADHNVLFGNGNGPTHSGCSGLSFAGGNRATDPLFTNYAVRDFRLVSGSPAIDYALVQYSPTTDHAGIARSYGAGPDAGAFERF